MMLRKAIIAGASAFLFLFILNAGLGEFFRGRIIDQSKETASIVSSLNKASILKIQTSEFYNINGRLPDTNQELGFGEPTTHADRWIKSITIGPLGLIDIALKDTGHDAHIYLKPFENLSGVGSQTDWRCYVRGVRQAVLDTMHSPSCTLLTENESVPAALHKTNTTATVDDLVNAVYARRSGLVKSLLAQQVNVNGRNKLGESPLRAAIERGNHTDVKDLITAGADVDEVLPGQERRTLLMHATERRSYSADKIRALLGAGADIEARDANGKTALMYAAIADDHQAARILVQLGANINAKDNKGQTAANYAALMHGTNTNITRLLEPAKQRPKDFIYRLPTD